jgi:ACS family sodium-dependent inorganic phosphate cotransporter-like MFS transporter 5
LKKADARASFISFLFISCPKDGPFVWDESIQQLIATSFFWGYLVLQIPGGRWAEQYGGKRLISLSILGSALCTLVAPFAAKAGYMFFVATRVVMGLTQVKKHHWST